VIELVPPAVRTELLPGQSQNEAFLPLDDYVDETMALLEAQPDATEILVERVKPLRFAEVNGTLAQVTGMLDGHVPH
jgi:short-subunit dehydrogenase involved in D-alanine esterification of teichoic acids